MIVGSIMCANQLRIGGGNTTLAGGRFGPLAQIVIQNGGSIGSLEATGGTPLPCLTVTAFGFSGSLSIGYWNIPLAAWDNMIDVRLAGLVLGASNNRAPCLLMVSTLGGSSGWTAASTINRMPSGAVPLQAPIYGIGNGANTTWKYRVFNDT